jgi:undecaprenyl-diphosphatase
MVAVMKLKNKMVVLAAVAVAAMLLTGPQDGPLPAWAGDWPSVTAASAPAERPVRISVWQAAVLGVVEGLTEYLPVSSTGHLILVGDWLGLNQAPGERGPAGRAFVESPAVNAFEVVIQLGAILAVLGLYRRRVGQMLSGLAAGVKKGTGCFFACLGKSRRRQEDEKVACPLFLNEQDSRGLHLAGLLMVAFLPAAVIGYLFHKQIEEHLFGPRPVVYALAVGGVLMIVVEYFFWLRNKGARRISQVDQVRYWQALVIGLAQCLAMWPGTSRSMVTIIAALVVGLDMVAAAEFSFLLALPTLGAATVYSGLAHRHELMQSVGPAGLLVGLVVSGLVAAVAVKLFVRWLTRHGLIPFGVYRILLAAGLLAYFAW